jgi:hypothetical protein
LVVFIYLSSHTIYWKWLIFFNLGIFLSICKFWRLKWFLFIILRTNFVVHAYNVRNFHPSKEVINMNPYILYRNMLMLEYVFLYLQILEVKIITVYNFNDQLLQLFIHDYMLCIWFSTCSRVSLKRTHSYIDT